MPARPAHESHRDVRGPRAHVEHGNHPVSGHGAKEAADMTQGDPPTAEEPIEPGDGAEAARDLLEGGGAVDHLDRVVIALERRQARHVTISEGRPRPRSPDRARSSAPSRPPPVRPARSVSSSTKSTVADDMLPKYLRTWREWATCASSRSRRRRACLDHPATRGVEHEVPDVVLLEPLRFHEAIRHLRHHGGADAPDFLREHHARAASGKLEAHGGQMLRAKEALVLDDGRPFPVAAHREGPRPVREDGVATALSSRSSRKYAAEQISTATTTAR